MVLYYKSGSDTFQCEFFRILFLNDFCTLIFVGWSVLTPSRGTSPLPQQGILGKCHVFPTNRLPASITTHVIVGLVTVFLNQHAKWQQMTSTVTGKHTCEKPKCTDTQTATRTECEVTCENTFSLVTFFFYFGAVSTFCPSEHAHIVLSSHHSSCRKTCFPLFSSQCAVK